MTLYTDLTELSTEDRRKIQALLHERRQTRSNFLTNHPWVGNRIWRPVEVISWQGVYVKEPWDALLIQNSVSHSGTPTKILRARRRRSDNEWIAKDADERGIVCVCYDPIPPDWTYFEIVKVHCLESSLMVRPVAGDINELLRMF